MAIDRLRQFLPKHEIPSTRISDLQFAMEANGFSPRENELWKPDNIQGINRELRYLAYEFYSNVPKKWSFSENDPQGIVTAMAFKQEGAMRMVQKYRDIGEDSARRINFLLGLVVRSLTVSLNGAINSTEFVSSMTNLGSPKSGEAIAAAMVMHVLNDHPLVQNTDFKDSIYHMAEAIEEDPITVLTTEDLGMSQAARLRLFFKKRQKDGNEIVIHDINDFTGFPTIGAEFHIPKTQEINETFWQRVALLNIAQYQSGSYVPFSRTDEGLIEIRMNPSIYPVAIANWKLMLLLLPELKRSYFTISINRPQADFLIETDIDLITFLHNLAVVDYAGLFRDVPQVDTPHQVKFGDWYLGQTVKVSNGHFELSGNWSGNVGHEGQLNICAGYGDLFPNLAFYLSMALAEPSLTKYLERRVGIIGGSNIKNAVMVNEGNIKRLFVSLNNLIRNTRSLNQAAQSGLKIIEEFKP